MQWFTLLNALFLLLLLALKFRRTAVHTECETSKEPSGTGAQAGISTSARLRLSRLQRFLFFRKLVSLHRIPPDRRTPCARVLCRYSRFLMEEAYQSTKGIPRLPCTDAKQLRVCLFAQSLHAPLTCASLRQALQAHPPFTNAELEALPAAVRISLLEQLMALSRTCTDETAAAEAIASLRAAEALPWNDLLEEASVLHRLLCQDPVYAAMTAESRAYYRRQAAAIACRTRLSEQRVACCVMALCRQAEPGELDAHAGYYLLDDGYEQLLNRLQSATMASRMHSFGRRHARALRTLAGWGLFALLLLTAWLVRLPPLLWLPFALAGLIPFLCAPSHRFMPSLQPDGDPPALVICTAVLSSAAQAVQAVRSMAVMQLANPDPSLHFLLLGHFLPAFLRTEDSDGQIIRAASEAVSALCESTGHAFFYLQCERSAAHAEDALHTVLALTAGDAAQLRLAHASVGIQQFHQHYRCVLLTEPEAMMPPGSVRKLIGVMLHPLHMRQKRSHRMRGFSVLQPVLLPALHAQESRFSSLDLPVFAPPLPQPTCLIDPIALLEDVQRSRTGAIPLSCLACLNHPPVFVRPPQTLHAFLRMRYRRIRSLLHTLRRDMDGASRRRWRAGMLKALEAPLLLALTLCAAATGTWRLWAAALLTAALSARSLRRTAAEMLLLPCSAYTSLAALIRTLYERLCGRQLPMFKGSPADETDSPAARPPMLFFAVFMGCAALFAALSFAPRASHALCWLHAATWALFAFALPALERPRAASAQPTPYMREVLLRIAQRTLTCFETAITESDHALPTAQVQIDPNKGIDHSTSPDAVGLYLCAMLSAWRIGLLPVQEALGRMKECAATLDGLARWKGLFFDRYDTRTLAPVQTHVSTQSNGILAVSLLTCAQGVRALPQCDGEAFASLAVQLDGMARQMQLDALYDRTAHLFLTGFDASDEKPDAAHETLLASQSRLAGFAAVILGQVPPEHFEHLSRRMGDGGALSSPAGSAADYLLPALFHPLVRKTALSESCRRLVRLQRRRKRKGVYGLSECACYAFDDQLRYEIHPFGVSALAQDPLVEDSAVSPYAAMLMLPLETKRAFVNLGRLLVLGMEGPLGLFEAVDFAASRTGGEPMRIIRSHSAAHQAVILCAIANTLSDGYLASLFFHLPRAQAYRLLLEEPAHHMRRRHRFHFPAYEDLPSPAPQLDYEAQPLRFPVEAHLLHGHHTAWLIDAHGGGCLLYHGISATHFDDRCFVPCGMRVYLRDSQSGRCWTAADPLLLHSVRYEAHQAVFGHTHQEIACEMRLWLNPLDGSAVHFLTLENQSGADRTMEVCSYAQPARRYGAMEARRICRSGIQGRCGAHTWLHLLTCDAEPALIRIQCDQNAFIGHGRSVWSPRAMERPIGAVSDVLGQQSNPCLSLRGQFALPAGASIRIAFITQITDTSENPSAFCERYADAAAVLRSHDEAQTASAAAARFWGMEAEDLTLCCRLSGALAYRAQPFQQAGIYNGTPLVSTLEKEGLSIGQHMLVAECPADTLQSTVRQLLKAHAFLQAYGFPFALVFVLRERTRFSAVRELIEEEIQSCLGARQHIHLIERADDDEASLLRAAARLVLQADRDIPPQLDALATDVSAAPVYLCPPAQTALPPGQPTQLSNTFGGFVPSDGSYQITLAPGRNTPSPWRNPIGSDMADESGLCSGEAFYLRDEDGRLLWSPTRRELGHALEVRTTHAPGETTYESSAHGVHTRINCFACADDSAQIRLFSIHNASETARTLRLFHKRPFGLAQLQAQPSGVSGWDPASGRYVCLCSIEAECTCVVMSEGGFHGLWGLAPHALAALKSLPSPGGNTAVLSFGLHLSPGAHITLATASAHAENQAALEALMESIRSTGAGECLRSLRRHWDTRLSALTFDLPDPAASLLMSRWIPYQMMHEGTELPALFPMVYTDPAGMKRLLQERCRRRDQGSLYEQLLLPYLCARFALITGERTFLAGDVLERCMKNLRSVKIGAHGMPEETRESVWLGMFLCEAIRMILPFCTGEDHAFLAQQRGMLLASIDRFAWEGSWYASGWEQEKSGIDLAVQSWAVLCGAERERCEIAMENAWRMLHKPAAREPLHTLTAFWAARAFLQLGQTERAWQLAFSRLPIAHASTRQQAVRYQAEPYALAMEIDANGRGSRTWFAQGAGWCWCIWLEELLGFRREGECLRFTPVAPQGWNSLTLTLRFGASTYHLHANRDTQVPAGDGKPLEDGRLKLEDDGKIHEAFFPMR